MRDAREDLNHGIVGQGRSSRSHEHRKRTLRKGGGRGGGEEDQISARYTGRDGRREKGREGAYLVVPMAASDATEDLGRKLVGRNSRLLDLQGGKEGGRERRRGEKGSNKIKQRRSR